MFLNRVVKISLCFLLNKSMKNFQQYITEKTINGITGKYLFNPSAQEVFYYWKLTQDKSLRLWLIEDNIYVWGNKNIIHNDFIHDEIPDEGKMYSYQRMGKKVMTFRANIDPLGKSEGTRIGFYFYRKHEKLFSEIFKMIEEYYKNVFVDAKFILLKDNELLEQKIYAFRALK